MWHTETDKKAETVGSGIAVTVAELITLRGNAILHPGQSAKKTPNLPGQRPTSIRGRGIEFDANREYQAGDDIRNMAWRVTARSLKPHVKMYHEEKERPVWLAMDLSPSLYFGTRGMFKSVNCIKQAALLGWSYLQKRERVGALIAEEYKILAYKPQTSERHFLEILHKFSECSTQQPVFNDKQYLTNLLVALQQHARSGSLIYIFSDFFQFDIEVQQLILHLARKTQVMLQFVYDVFEAESPPPYQYVITDGSQTSLFNMENEQARLQYSQQFQTKRDLLINFSRKHNLALKIVRTDEPLVERVL